ncbi:uncharacterized protein [Malus domestica]|uniref:uncharacterized protein isoform X2 n=1 Tax=Malus domestica TaxID=3750 RepID=UPI003975EECD
MDTSSSAHGAGVAASSSSSQSSNRWKYEVFLSFRGDDTRTTFTDHLFIALRNAGINTSIDYQLTRGGNIQSELDQEIEGSRIAVIIFSKRYAESRWCLRELSKIMRCLKDQEGKIVCPIFYDVDPSQVRKQNDSFGKAFQKHEWDEDPNEVKQWREDLKASADLVGWNLKTTADGREGVFIEKIVGNIKELLKTADLKEAKHSDGMTSRVQNFSTEYLDVSTEYLDVGRSPDVQIIGIRGMGNIGKTMSDLPNCRKLKDIPNLENSLDHMYSILMEGCTSLTDTFKENLRRRNAFGGIFLSGNDIPNWLAYVTGEDKTVKFQVPPSIDYIGGLALGIVYSLDNSDSTGSLCIDVVNCTQRTKFRIWPMKATVTASHEYYLWLGNLSNKKLNLKGGDMVLLKAEFYGGDNRIKENKTGVDMVKWDLSDEDTDDDTQLDIRHVFFCYKTPEAWPWCINGSKSDPLPKFFTSALKARKNDITFKTSMTVIEGHEGTEFSDGDVLIFPQMIKYRGLKESDVDSFVDDVLVNHKPWASGVQEALTGSHVMYVHMVSR